MWLRWTPRITAESLIYHNIHYAQLERHEPRPRAPFPREAAQMQGCTFTTRQLRERLGVPLVTARRWMRTGRIPTLARLAIMVILGGDLGKIDPAWKGWTLTRGKLVSPENWDYRPGDVTVADIRARARAHLSEQATLRQTGGLHRGALRRARRTGRP
jgi:hypothetical protein